MKYWEKGTSAQTGKRALRLSPVSTDHCPLVRNLNSCCFSHIQKGSVAFACLYFYFLLFMEGVTTQKIVFYFFPQVYVSSKVENTSHFFLIYF